MAILDVNTLGAVTNTNCISFKLGAERKLGMAIMYAHLFSVRFQK